MHFFQQLKRKKTNLFFIINVCACTMHITMVFADFHFHQVPAEGDHFKDLLTFTWFPCNEKLFLATLHLIESSSIV